MNEKETNEKELHKQKFQAQLDEWEADIDKLKARASGAKADAQITMNKEIAVLETNLKEARTKLSALAETSGEAWHSAKKGVESAWDQMKHSIKNAAAKL